MLPFQGDVKKIVNFLLKMQLASRVNLVFLISHVPRETSRVSVEFWLLLSKLS